MTGGSWEEAFGTPCHGPCRLDAFVAVPLLATGEAVGTLVLGRHRAEPFSPGEVALLSSVGVQLGVAVNAARLFAGVRRRLADLEAIHALALRVLSGAPGDVRSLLRDACREIARALSARSAVVFLAEDGGATLRAVASAGSPAMPEGLAFERARDAISDEVMRRREPVLSDDLTRDPRSVMNGFDVAPHAAVAVPLASRSAVRGVVFVADLAGRAFSPADVALANALAGELGVGLDNAELVEETRRRAEELGLVNEVGRSLAQTLDIEQLLLAGVRNLARIVDAPAAYLALASDDGKELELRAVSGAAGGGARDRIPADGATAALAQLVYQRREPVLVDDAANDPRVGEDMRRLSGARAYLGLPLVVRDRTIGTAVIVETRRPRRFTPAEVERAASIANQLAVAAENARLYEDLRRSYAQLERAQQQVVQGERLAALGELSAVVAHEVRNPLGVIFNSIGSLRRLVPPVGDAKLLIDIVGEEAERLNRIVGDLLDFAHPSQPQLRPEPIARVAEDAIGAALSPEGSRVEVVRELDPALPPVALDARLFRQAVLNIAVNAVQAMPRGGRITLRTRRDGEHAVVEIEDTGPGIPEEVRARIFEPFFTTKATGTGLGLAVVRRIVEGHGGEVSLRSAAGSGTVFSLRLAIAGPATVENLPGLRSDRRP